MDLQGSLSEFSVDDILQFLGSSGKTGLLRITRQPHTMAQMGSVFFVDGKMVHAELESLQGEEVIHNMMLWDEGRFVFDPDITSEARSIREANATVLIEAARRKDEWDYMAKAIPSLDWIPEFTLPEDQNTGQQITLNTSEWVVLSKIDGRRSLREVALAAGLSEFNTCRLLFTLIQNHLIKLTAPS